MNRDRTPAAWHTLEGAPPPGSPLGRLHDLIDGQAHRTPGPFSVILLREGDSVTAYVNRCAHFGVPLAAEGFPLLQQPRQRITCNVHYAHYRWSDGHCLSGDCNGEGLLPIPVAVAADGTVYISNPQ